MATPFTCSGCESTWTGMKVSHCARCHETFSVPTWFDRHQVRGKCLDPALIPIGGKANDTRPAMKLDAHGKWVGAIANPAYATTTDSLEEDE